MPRYLNVKERVEDVYGVRVRVTHQRLTVPAGENGEITVYLPKGGRTVAVLQHPKSQVTLSTGVANCSDLDTYNKSVGRMIAVGRAVKEYLTKYPEVAEGRRESARTV